MNSLNDYQENYGNGWIKIYRSIKNHWIYQNDKYFKWWITLLIEVNHSGNKIILGYDIIDIKKGQSAKSIRTWALLFNCGTKQVTNFFIMLEKDKMLKREILGKGKQSTTLITIDNYTQYQNKEKRKGNARETQEAYKQEVKKEKNIPDFLEFKIYALSKSKIIDKDMLKLKYESWKVNNWKDGNNKSIKNWKSKLLNTIPYLTKKNINYKNDAL